jgi:endoglucanase
MAFGQESPSVFFSHHELTYFGIAMQTLSNLSGFKYLVPLALLVSLSIASCGGGGADTVALQNNNPSEEAPALASGNAPGASAKANQLSAAIAPGINLGNVFEAPTDNAWGIPFSDTTTLVQKAKTMGFKSIRMPVRWSNHASLTAPYTIDAAFMTRVKSEVQNMINQGFIVVLNMHHYRDLDGDTRDPGEVTAPNVDHNTRFVLIWKQIANEFKDFSNDNLLFEVYNEPHGKLQTSPASVNDPWNNLLARAMGQIRATNPSRVVVVGPSNYNNAYNLQHLRLPNDANMIVTIHQYEPFGFTHQGASWISNPPPPTGQTCCSNAQKNQITTILGVAKNWSTVNRYPIYVGEFGAYSNNDYSASMITQRVNFNSYMREEMSKVSFSWAYWELASGFGIYDRATQLTRTTLLDSLIPTVP